jgi:hypothetical protein
MRVLQAVDNETGQRIAVPDGPTATKAASRTDQMSIARIAIKDCRKPKA